MANNKSGLGYDDLRGSVINYEYDDFDKFHLTIYNNKVKWHGQKGYFANIAREVIPQISKISDGIYFISWSTGTGGDNVVMNIKNMKVNAHLFDASAPEMIWNIHGKIHSINSEDTIFPHIALTPDKEVFDIIGKNIQEKNLKEFQFTNKPSSFEEDVQARYDLCNKTISFGDFEIYFNKEEMQIKHQGNTYKTTTCATKIANGIYFMSWDIKDLKGHVVINQNINKVFTHLQPDGERVEKIFELK